MGGGEGDRDKERRGGGAFPPPLLAPPPRPPAGGGGEGLLPLETKRGGGDIEGDRRFGPGRGGGDGDRLIGWRPFGGLLGDGKDVKDVRRKRVN